jgi:hypothetical protein
VLVRIYDSANLQYALNADNEVGSTNSRYTPVLYSSCNVRKYLLTEVPIQIIVRENSEAPWQMWSFDSDNMDQTQFNKETNTLNANIPAQRKKEPKVQSEEEKRV